MPKKSKPKLEPVEGFLTPQQFSAVYKSICDLFEELEVEPELAAMTLVSHAGAMLTEYCGLTADNALTLLEDMIKHIRIERKALEASEAIKPHNN